MYKAYCDSCGVEIDFKGANQHDLWLQHPELGKISIVVMVRENKPKGEGAGIFNVCYGCLQNIGRLLLEVIPEATHEREEKQSDMVDPPAGS